MWTDPLLYSRKGPVYILDQQIWKMHKNNQIYKKTQTIRNFYVQK